MFLKQNTIDRAKGHVVKAIIFIHIYYTYNYDSAIISKTRANQRILELFSYSAAQKHKESIFT